MTSVVLITVSPRAPASGAATPIYLAGGGNLKGYRYQNQHWRAGVTLMPRFRAEIGFDENGWNGAARPATGAIAWAPATKTDLSGLAGYYWPKAVIAIQEGDEATEVFATRLSGKVADATVQDGQLIITAADLSDDLAKPLVTARFAGTGGAEGGTEAKNRIKRRSWGRVFNVEGMVLDKANNIYEFGDPSFPLQQIVTLRDMGRDASPAPAVLAWQGSIAATLAALVASVPVQGSGVVAPSIASAKWWTQPAGPFTADLKGEIGAGYVETVASIADRILTAVAGPAVTNVATANGWRGAAAGIHVSENETIAATLDRLLMGVSLVWILDPTGTVTLRELTFTGSVATLTSDRVQRLRTLPPVKTRRVGYQKSYRTHTDGEIAASLLQLDDVGDLATLDSVTLGVNVYQNAGPLVTDGTAITSLGTAAGIAGQGALATLSGVTLGTNVYRSGGGPALVNADVITNLGTAASIYGQGALATLSAVSGTNMVNIPSGMTLNSDPGLNDVAVWTQNIGSTCYIVSDSDFIASHAWEITSTNPTNTIYSERIPIDPTRAYTASFTIKNSVGGNKTCYGMVIFYDSAGVAIDGNTYPSGWPGVGTFHYYGLVGTAAPTTATTYSINFGAGQTAGIPAAARFVRIGWLPSYAGTTGTQRVGSPMLTELMTYGRLSNSAARLGVNVVRADGSTSLTDALAVTSLGTAAAISGQGTLATLNRVGAATIAAGAIGESLIPNGGAEEGTVAGWLGGAYYNTGSGLSLAVVSGAQNSGKYSFAIQKALTSGQFSMSLASMIPVTPGKTYLFRWAAVSSVACASGWYVRIFTYNAAQATVTSTDLVSNGPLTTGWATSEGTWTCPAGTYFIDLCFINYVNAGPTVYVDDVQMFEQVTYRGLSNSAARLGVNVVRNDGSTSLTDALAVTSLGTAAAFVGQAAIATDTDAVARILDMRGDNFVRDPMLDQGGALWLKETTTGYTAPTVMTCVSGFGAGTHPSVNCLSFPANGNFGRVYANGGVVVPLPGRAVYCSVIARSSGTAGANLQIGVFWYDAAIGVISAPSTAIAAPAPASGWVQLIAGPFVAPAGAASCLPFLHRGSSANGLWVTGWRAGAAADGATLGSVFNSNTWRNDGTTLVTDALAVTSLGTAAAISGQGAFATVNSAAYGSSLLTGFSTLATLSQVNLGAAGRVYRDDGSTRLTDSLAVTSLGTAAAIAGQGWGATAAQADVANNESAGGILRIARPANGYSGNNGSATAGAIRIRLPAGAITDGDKMIRFAVSIYEYATSKAQTYEISGYTWNGGGGAFSGTWLNQSAALIGGSGAARPVYFGKDATGWTVHIGTPGGTWEYPAVTIRDLEVSYGTPTESLWKTGWSISFDTGTPPYSATVANPTAGDAVFGINARETWGGTLATLANFKTASGTAAGISGQGTGATASNLTQLNAAEGAKLGGVEASADLTRVLTLAPAQAIQYDYTGSSSTQLPKILTCNFYGRGADVTPSTSFVFTASGCSIDGTGCATGQVRLTAVSAANASILVDATYLGVTRSGTIAIQRLLGANPGGAGGGGAGATGFSVDVSATITDTSYDGSPQPFYTTTARMRSNGSGQIRLTLNAEYHADPNETAQVNAKAQKSTDGSTWSDAGLSASGTSAAGSYWVDSNSNGMIDPEDYTVDEVVGTITANSLVGSFTASTDYYIRWIAYKSGTASSVGVSGTASGAQS